MEPQRVISYRVRISLGMASHDFFMAERSTELMKVCRTGAEFHKTCCTRQDWAREYRQYKNSRMTQRTLN